jgi:hypothetical protein
MIQILKQISRPRVKRDNACKTYMLGYLNLYWPVSKSLNPLKLIVNKYIYSERDVQV